MPTIDWAFLCDYAFVDAAGKASIIGTFENVNFLSLPAKHNQLYLAMGMKIAPGENFEMGIVITSPTGKEIANIHPQKVGIPSNAPNVGKGIFTFGFYTTEFSETGEHHIEIFVDGNSVHFIPLRVSLISKK